LNIAFITPEYLTEQSFDGGLANYLFKISDILSKKGHRIFIIVSSYEDKHFQCEGVDVVRVKKNYKLINTLVRITRGKIRQPIEWIIDSCQLNKRLKYIHNEFGIDIVQYTSYKATSLFRVKEIPSVVRISSYQPLWDEAYNIKANSTKRILYRLELLGLSRTSMIYGPSQFIADIVEKKIKKRVHLIETPMITQSVSDDSIFNDSLQNKKYLLYFGTIGLLKGVKEIAEITLEVLNRYPEIYIVFAGKNTSFQNSSMMDYVWNKSGNKRGRCIYLGSLNHKYLWPIIVNSYAVLLPSRIDNFPNTCIEAMTAGKIVIGTNKTSFSQIIKNKINGYLCEPYDPESLLRTIDEIMSLDKKKRMSIESKSKETVGRMEPDLIVDQTLNLYSNCIYSVNTMAKKVK